MHILITGASRGIGYELVKRFSEKENNTILAVSRNKGKLKKLQEECHSVSAKGPVDIIAADLEHDEDIQGIANYISSKFPHLDILINNAGYLYNHSFENFPEKEMYRIFNVNVFSVVKLTNKLLTSIEKSKKPHIINISSMGGFQGSSKYPGLSMYSASKGAIAVLTESMATELSAKNISVNCLALGAVQTEMLEEAFPGYNPPMEAHQMAEFIEEFATNGHKYFNGKILPVNLSNP